MIEKKHVGYYRRWAMKIQLCKIISGLYAKVLQGDINHETDGGVIDSRKIRGGELFFALKGENTDGHNFLSLSVEAGAIAAIVEKNVTLPEHADFPILQVSDTKKALQKCAKLAREVFTGKVVAVTGSNGKTTTKDMIAEVTAKEFLTKKTYANFNNEIGLPLTLLNTPKETQVLVLEMGMRAQGEIAFLADIAQPQIGVITNIGISHMELLQSQANIARAKFELIDALPSDGIAILNADDSWCTSLSSQNCETLTYGFSLQSDIRGSKLHITKQGTYFTVHYENNTYEAFLPTWGKHNVANSLAALGVGIALGMSITSAIDGLKSYLPTSMRLEIKTGNIGCHIIDDAYNANPISVAASLEVLKSIATKRSVAVLGEMYELGDLEKEGHEAVGTGVVNNGIDILVTVGKKAESIAIAAKKDGMTTENIHIFQNNDLAGKFLQGFLLSEDTVLVKGSRGMHMETIVDMLTERIES